MTNTENPMGYDLNTTVRKARRIIEIYMLLTASNPLKDNVRAIGEKRRNCNAEKRRRNLEDVSKKAIQ